MKKITVISIGLALLLACQGHGEILYRATFGYLTSNNPPTPSPLDVENPSYENWSAGSSSPGLIRPKEENDDPFQTQSHGRFSLFLKDPDSTTNYAMATSPVFTNNADEYMTEFWFYVPSGGVAFNDGFPILTPFYTDGVDTFNTDVKLWVVPIKTNPAYLEVWASTSDDTMIVGRIDSTNLWYKLQLHRHSDTVDVYLMSELKASIKAYSSLKTNILSIGSNKVNIQGEGYWDDFIVTTVPQGRHPRLSIRNVRGIGAPAKSVDRQKLKALSCSQQWGEPGTRHSPHYATMDDALRTVAMAFGYDGMFDKMTNYEKMNAQNALLTLGCQQLYYESKTQANLAAAVKSALGCAALAIDPPNTAYLEHAAASLRRSLASPRYEDLEASLNAPEAQQFARQSLEMFLALHGGGIGVSLSRLMAAVTAEPRK